MAPAHHSSQVEVILSDEERDVLEQRAEAMALTSLQALPAEKLRKALPAVKQGILKRLLSQASHDEPAVPKPEKAAPAAEAPPLPPPLPELDTCDDEELDRLRCSLRQKPKELPPPQDGVEAFGDDPWFAPKSEVRVALSEAAEAHHGSFKILVGTLLRRSQGSANAPWRAPCCAWGVPPGALESRTWRMRTANCRAPCTQTKTRTTQTQAKPFAG